MYIVLSLHVSAPDKSSVLGELVYLRYISKSWLCIMLGDIINMQLAKHSGSIILWDRLSGHGMSQLAAKT